MAALPLWSKQHPCNKSSFILCSYTFGGSTPENWSDFTFGSFFSFFKPLLNGKTTIDVFYKYRLADAHHLCAILIGCHWKVWIIEWNWIWFQIICLFTLVMNFVGCIFCWLMHSGFNWYHLLKTLSLVRIPTWKCMSR